MLQCVSCLLLVLCCVVVVVGVAAVVVVLLCGGKGGIYMNMKCVYWFTNKKKAYCEKICLFVYCF